MIYREKLRCPLSYWVIAAAFGLSFVTAVGFYVGPWVAVASGVVTALGIAAVLWQIGRVEIVVDDRGITVERSLLEWSYVGSAAAHDAAATRDRLGRDADVRAFVVDRPYLAESVEIAVDDAADPHPYWLVGTRQPQQLLAALSSGRPRSEQQASDE